MSNKVTPKKINQNRQNKQAANGSPLVTHRLFYYTNGIFMGTTRSLRRIGTGVITFNDGTCAIVSYNNNQQLNGISVFYKNRRLISAEYIRNRLVSIAYRIDGFLLFLRYNQQSQIHGDCYIISFLERSIHLVGYQEGHMKSKIQMLTIQKLNVQSVFLNQAFHLIVGKKHSKAIRYQITSQEIPHIRMKKIGNKVQVNFMQNSQQSKLVQGLGFSFVFRSPEHGGYDPQTNRFRDQFQLNIVERGFYKDNMLEGYAMKIFKNNNIYEGFFSNNVFHGKGCLKNTHKGSWVYGLFANGEMKQIIDFSNQGDDQTKCEVFLQNLRQTQPNFINQMIQQNNFDFLDTELQRISSRGNIQQYRSQTFQQRKQQIMRKIITQFTQLQVNSKNTIQQDLKKLKNSKALLSTLKKSQQQEKQDPKNINQTVKKQKLNSLVPQSMAHLKFYDNSDNNMAKAFQQEMKRYQRQREKKTIVRSPTLSPKNKNKNLSKIFQKDYSHLQKLDKPKKNELELSLRKVQSKKKKSRQRKSQIFSARIMQKNMKSDISLRNIPEQSNKIQKDISLTPLKRRSPTRTTKIFVQTLKLKKVNDHPNLKTVNYNNEEDGGITKLQSIKKGSIEKKNLAKSKNKRAMNPIFEQNRQKQTETIGKFAYRYGDVNNEEQENIQNNNKTIKISPIKY